MVGSTNGRGVFSSKKMGRLIATFEPRLVLIFPVRVLVKSNINTIDPKEEIEYTQRESNMRVRDLLRKK